MGRGLKAALAVMVALLLGAGVLATSAVARVVGEPITLDGLNSSARVAVTPDAFWFSEMNRDGICRLLTGCESATGSGSDWVFRMGVDVPVTGFQTVDMNVRVAERVLLERMRLSLSYDNVLGSLRGDLVISLKPSGGSTIVTVKVEDMTGNGVAAAAIPELQSRLAPDLQSGLTDLNGANARAAAKVLVTVTPGRVAVARVKVTGTSLTAKPPTAKGQMRVVVGGKVVCTAPVKASKGQCRFKPPARGAKVQVSVTGTFSNGYALSGSATKRYGR